MKHAWLLPAVVLASSAFADEAEDLFVEANLIGVFYHELGHAVIDLMQLPVFGQEEDAADVASIMLIDAFFDNESAIELAYDASLGFWGEAILVEELGYEVAYWDTHGPDEQRFYNTVCLFYGGDPDTRDDFAEDMGLPEERAETCEEEYELALDSWGPVFDDLADTDGQKIRFSSKVGETPTAALIAAEVDFLNESFSWPQTLSVTVEGCGEANAFYDLGTKEVIMCEEFADHLRDLHGILDGQ